MPENGTHWIYPKGFDVNQWRIQEGASFGANSFIFMQFSHKFSKN